MLLVQSFLVGGFNPSEKYLSIRMIIPNIWEHKKCSKPPTSFLETHRNLALFPSNLHGPKDQIIRGSSPPRRFQDAGRTIPMPPYLDLLAPGLPKPRGKKHDFIILKQDQERKLC